MEFDDRMISPHLLDGEEQEMSIRPKTMDDYIGQDKVKQNLEIYIRAALERHEALDHTLLYGPPGLGKTTLAGIIANEMGVNLRVTSGPAIEKPMDMAAILTNLGPQDVLFVDEIHRLPRTVEEILYSAMEDYSLDIIVGKGPSAQSVRLSLQPFTLVGATTRAGLLSAPLRDRFGVVERLELYTTHDLSRIIKRTSGILGIDIDDGGAREIASRSRGTPRIANRLLKRVRDYAQVRREDFISKKSADEALKMLEIDSLGLDAIDKKMMEAIMLTFDGGPVGLDTLAATIGEDARTIEDVYEPYLLQLGFLNRTPRGRVATRNAYSHYRITPRDDTPNQTSFKMD